MKSIIARGHNDVISELKFKSKCFILPNVGCCC